MLASPFNKLVLSRYVGVATVPIYEIAYNGSMQVRNLIEGGIKSILPEVSRISSSASKNISLQLRRLDRSVFKFIAIFGIPVYGTVFAMLMPILKFWLRDKYVDSLTPVFYIMLLSTLISLLGVPSYYILLGFGMVSRTMMAHIILAAINIGIVVAYIVGGVTISVAAVA